MGLQRVAALGACHSPVWRSWLSGCSDDAEGTSRLAMPDPASEQGEHILDLWQGAWIAALITGVIVWGLIFYVVVRFRRRSDDEIPVQTRYNLPLEIFYTIAPVMMVIVFFTTPSSTQNVVLEDETGRDHIIEVTGQQWSWTFNYGLGELTSPPTTTGSTTTSPTTSTSTRAAPAPTSRRCGCPSTRRPGSTCTARRDPRLRRPGFLMKMDVIPGRVNHYVITPTRIGAFTGKCYELCGVYHSRMLFKVHVVSREDYEHTSRSSRTPADLRRSRCSAATTPTPRPASTPEPRRDHE